MAGSRSDFWSAGLKMNRGTVVSLNMSRGGVPKLPVQKAELGSLGFVGDGHDDAESHGGPERAVCIYAAELIEALQQEGHPISPGSAGENITVMAGVVSRSIGMRCWGGTARRRSSDTK